MSVSGGAEYGCAALRDGHVKCWGPNQYGQLGNRSVEKRSRPVRTPVLVEGLDDAVSVAAGYDVNCAVRRGGGVVCWGNNEDGSVGATFVATQATPVAVRSTK